jgi:uncharacterized RDD family membrane protein YckC
VLRDVISGMAGDRKPLARPSLRLAAYLIDRAIFYAVLAGLVYAVELYRELSMPPFDPSPVEVVMVEVLYAGFAVYEAWMLSRRGQTLGKMVVRLRVVRPDGTPVTRKQAWGRAFIRSLLLSACFNVLLITDSVRAAVWVFLLTPLDPLLALVTPQRTAIHDLAARTRVYRTE